MKVLTHTEYVPYTKDINIHEHRAPSDESLRLINEYRNKAKDSIIATIEVKDNLINGLILYFSDDIMENILRYQGKFKINNVDIEIKGSIDKFELDQQKFTYGSRGVMEHIYNDVANKIADGLFNTAKDFIKTI